MLRGRMNVNITEIMARELQGYQRKQKGKERIEWEVTSKTKEFVCVFEEIEAGHCHAECLPRRQPIRQPSREFSQDPRSMAVPPGQVRCPRENDEKDLQGF